MNKQCENKKAYYKRIIMRLYALDKKLVIICIIYSIALIIDIFIPIFLLNRLTFYSVSGVNDKIYKCIFVCFFSFLLATVARITLQKCEVTVDDHISKIRMELQRRYNYRFMNINYELLEDETFWENNKYSFHLLDTSETGIGAVLKYGFECLGNVFAVLFSQILLLQYSKVSLFFIIIIFLSEIFVFSEIKKAKIFMDEKKTLVLKSDYIFETTNNVKYAKELRIAGAKTFLNSKNKEYFDKIKKNDLESCIHNIFKRKVVENVLFLTFTFTFMFFVGEKWYEEQNYVNNVITTILILFQLWNNYVKFNECQVKIGTNSYGITNFFGFLESEDFVTCSKINFVQENKKDYEWEIKNLSFKYKKAAESTLRNVSFKIKEGDKVAIVGINGAGKSTLLKCLTGIYSEYEGEILYNNKDIKKYDISNEIGVLFQDTDIYPFSINENIACSDEKVNVDRVSEAINKIGLQDVISQNDVNINVYLAKLFSQEGRELSGGQKRKISLARIIYKEPKTIFLDEPTSNLDNESSKLLIDLLFSEFIKKTVIMVSHQFLLLDKFDTIIVLEDGQIIEIGSYDSLLRNKGKFYNLIQPQIEDETFER